MKLTLFSLLKVIIFLHISTGYAQETNSKILKVDELEVRNFNQSIESNLRESVSNYLGDVPFLITVASKLRRVLKYKIVNHTQLVKQSVERQKIVSFPTPLPEDIFKISQVQESKNIDTRETTIPSEDASNNESDGLPLPGSPLIENNQSQQHNVQQKDITRQNSQTQQNQVLLEQQLLAIKNYIDAQNKVIHQLNTNINNRNKSQPVKTLVTTSNILESDTVEVDRISIKVWLPDYLEQNKIAFVNDLIEEKTNLNYIRGDQLDIITIVFPGSNENNQAETELKVEKEEVVTPVKLKTISEHNVYNEFVKSGKDNAQWLWLLLTLFLLFLLWRWFVYRRRKNSVVYSARPFKENNERFLLTESNNYLPLSNNSLPHPVSASSVSLKLDIINEEITNIIILGDDLLSKTLSGENRDNMMYYVLLQKILGKRVFDKFSNIILTNENESAMHLVNERFKGMSEFEQYEEVKKLYNCLQSYKNQRMDSINNQKPFNFLNSMTDKQLVYLLFKEEIQNQALVLSQMEAKRSASIMKGLPVDIQGKIAVEMGQLSNLPIESYRNLANRLARLAVLTPDFTEVNIDGDEVLIRALEEMDIAGETTVLNSLRERNPQQYYRIKKVHISFPEINRINHEGLKNLLRELEKEPIAIALYDEDDEIRNHIFSALPKRAGDIVKQYLKTIKTPSNSEILKAKKLITRQARQLLKAGVITLSDNLSLSLPLGDNPVDYMEEQKVKLKDIHLNSGKNFTNTSNEERNLNPISQEIGDFGSDFDDDDFNNSFKN